MKVGVFSDSHGNREALKKGVGQMGEVDAIIHLGDCAEDGAFIRTLTNIPVYIISGNMDEGNEEGKQELLTKIGDVPFFACHGHRHGVKYDLNKLYHTGMEKGAKVILFGHTHKAFIEDDGELLIMNPGSIGAPRIGDPESYGIIYLEADDIRGEIFPLWDKI
ncbi:MAG: metallophosphoesterase family protein [Eubacteriaceae bacterium]